MKKNFVTLLRLATVWKTCFSYKPSRKCLEFSIKLYLQYMFYPSSLFLQFFCTDYPFSCLEGFIQALLRTSVFWKKIEFYKAESDCEAIVAAGDLGVLFSLFPIRVPHTNFFSFQEHKSLILP